MEKIEIQKLLFAYETEKRNKMLDDAKKNFIYYTNLETLHSILKNKEIWMRNVSCMNDYSEIRQGINLILRLLVRNDSDYLKKLLDVLNKITKEVIWKDFLEEILYKSSDFLLNNTYITCFSEHNKDDDILGKLSMWRAYGRGNGGAIVMDKDIILKPPVVYKKLILSPVAYSTDKKFEEMFLRILGVLNEHIKEFQQMNPREFENIMRTIFVASIMSLKHPGFKEECEWRLIYQDSGAAMDESIKSDVQCINGIPQKIFKINMSLIANKLIDHIIIGPTEYGYPALQVLEDDLKVIFKESYCEKRRIVFSGIPIRPSCI